MMCSAEHDGTTGMVYVKTSQQVNADNLKSYVKFYPAVKFTVEPTDDGFAISAEILMLKKVTDLTIKKGFRGRIGGILREEQFNQCSIW